MMLREPPALGSRHPARPRSLLREGARARRRCRKRDVHDLVRIFTMSVGDLLDDWFEHDGLKGSIASTGVVGVWAGPRTPGTAYNLLHHALGELDGIAGRLGPGDRRHGRDQPGDRPLGRGRGRRDPHRRRGRLDRRPRRPGHRRHPRRRRGDQGADRRLGRPPEDDDPRPGRRRELPRRGRRGHAPLPHPRRLGEDQHGALRAAPLRGRHARSSSRCSTATGVNLCPSIDYLERAWQDAPARQARGRALRRGRAALGDRLGAHRRRPLGDDDVHPVRPARTRTAWEGDARERYADACIEHLARYAPNVPGRDPRARGARAARPRADLRPRRTAPSSRASRASTRWRSCALTRSSPSYSTPVARPLPLRRRHPPRRRRDGRLGPQRGAADPPRPPPRRLRARLLRRPAAS